MNEMQKDKFELLISAAVVDCVHQEADDFANVDTSDVPETPRLYKKVMRGINSNKRTTVKVIIAAALVAVFLALTACACVQEIREYVWGVVTEWYGDHFEVSFEPEPVNTEEIQTTAPDAEKPTTIEQVAKLTYVPEGYTKAYELTAASQYMTEYYLENERKFSFVQCTYGITNSFMDGENANSVFVQVNGCESVLTEEADGEGFKYCLFWQDDQYRYYLRGYFSSIAELIQMAESVTLE